MIDNFFDTDKDGVYYIGHASALVRIDKKNIFFDPVWDHKPYGDYWYFDPPQVNLDHMLDDIHFCVISHIHEDHLCERILRKLADAGTIIVIMAGREKLFKRLKSYGCEIVEYAPMVWHHLLGAQLFFVPHAFNTVDSSCFIRSSISGYTVYHGNDNFLSKELLDKILSYNISVDVAMIPFAFIHWYPMLMANMSMTKRIDEMKRLSTQSLEQAFMFKEMMKPKHCIPFGNSLFHVENNLLNVFLSKPEDFIGAHPMHAGSWIIGDEVMLYMAEPVDPIMLISTKLKDVKDRVPGHQLVINDYVIDLEDLTVFKGRANKNFTKFDFKLVEFRKWLYGEITFEQAIGTRQFQCTRFPNEYNLKVFEFMNRWL